ncbi:hypothetical protein HPB48_019682 [Haemaphysalis longicornis]|uniref:Uncharacterized protein n=1 Tax=Haemaphysalis longicornis TaxID=44386 RepID=A0A9J6G3K1_HAELO|nr:hypothetical protein HPB48_019682 [Haemaphysalis longicornis]
MLEDVDYQRTVLDQLRGQVQEVQRRMSLSVIYLETLKQVSSLKGGKAIDKSTKRPFAIFK